MMTPIALQMFIKRLIEQWAAEGIEESLYGVVIEPPIVHVDNGYGDPHQEPIEELRKDLQGWQAIQ